jgi:hypothetical protein
MLPATLLNSHLASHGQAWASNGQDKQRRNYHLEQTSDYLSSNCYENRTQKGQLPASVLSFQALVVME